MLGACSIVGPLQRKWPMTINTKVLVAQIAVLFSYLPWPCFSRPAPSPGLPGGLFSFYSLASLLPSLYGCSGTTLGCCRGA